MHQIMAFLMGNKQESHIISLCENKVKLPLFNLAQMKSKHDKEKCKSMHVFCCCWLSLLFCCCCCFRATHLLSYGNQLNTHIATDTHLAYILWCMFAAHSFIIESTHGHIVNQFWFFFFRQIIWFWSNPIEKTTEEWKN